MKYSKPAVQSTASALAAVQDQSPDSKGTGFADRSDLLVYGEQNTISNPPAYQADE